MTLDELAAEVGPDRFRRACAAAWATAAATAFGRRGREWPDDLADVPHELSDLVGGEFDVGFALYRAMPCYANLMYLGFEEHSPAFWAEFRSLLDDPDDRLAAPAAYWLWCGPFEDPDEVGTAWAEMLSGAGDLRLARLLDASGPVPWPLKAPILGSLATRPAWHRHVLLAVQHAAYDVFGAIDVPAARALLNGLSPSPELQARLAELGD